MADVTTIRQFVAKLGYQVDEAAQRRFIDSLDGIKRTVEGIGLSLIGLADKVAQAVSDTSKSASALYQAIQNINVNLKGAANAEGISDFAQALEQKLAIPFNQTVGTLSAAAQKLRENFSLRKLFESEEFGGKGPLEQQLLHFRERLLAQPNEQVRQFMISQLNGLFPPEFLNALQRPGIPEALKEAQQRRTGLGIDLTQLTKDADQHREIMVRLSQDWDGLLKAVTEKVLPKINEAQQEWHDWIVKNFPTISAKVKEFGDAFEHAPKWVHETAAAILILNEAVGGLGTALKILEGLAILKFLFGGFGGRAATAAGGGLLAGAAGGIATFGRGLLRRFWPLLALEGLNLTGLLSGSEPPDQKTIDARRAEYMKAHPDFKDPINYTWEDVPFTRKWFAKKFGLGGGNKTELPNDTFDVPGATPSSDTGSGFGSYVQKMWKGFWGSIIGTAHAEELPNNVKQLSQRVYDLNDTLGDMLDRMNPLSAGGGGEAGGGGVPLGNYSGSALKPGVESGQFTAPLLLAGLPPAAIGLLKAMASPESGGAYDIKNGGARFSDFSQFPEGRGPGGTSSASGAFQFVSGTWHQIEKMFGLHDFKPETQGKGAWLFMNHLYYKATHRDLLKDLEERGHEDEIAAALYPHWHTASAANIRRALQPGSFMRTPAYRYENTTNNADKNVSINQNTTNNITASNPAEATNQLKALHDHQLQQMVRLTNNAMR